MTDKFILHRQQRHAFYALTLVSVLIGTVLVFLVPTSTELRWVASLSVGTLLAVMLVNTRVKISIHALIAAVAMIILPGITQSWTAFALSALAWFGATWSRVYLKRHKIVDVVLGSAVGISVGLAFLLLAEVLP
ncbi:phosphatase PAP2 family protein [Micrococcaceae sp. AOP34-BR2-30]